MIAAEHQLKIPFAFHPIARIDVQVKQHQLDLKRITDNTQGLLSL
jgi:hypothetical protein